MTRTLVSVISLILWLAPVLNAHAACCALMDAPHEEPAVELSPCGHEMASADNAVEVAADSSCGQGLDCCGISLGLRAETNAWDYTAAVQGRMALILPARTDPPSEGLLRPPSLS